MMRILLLASVWIAAGDLRGDGGKLVLTADKAPRYAVENNPELRAARGLVVEAEARTRSTGRLANPEIEAEVAGGQEFEGRISVGVTQRFPITARLRLERELSTLDVERARLEVLDRERQIRLAARQTIIELAASREAITLLEHQAKTARTAALSLSRSAVEGQSSALDSRLATLAGQELTIIQENLRAEETLVSDRLRLLLGAPASIVLVINHGLALPSTPPASRASGFRPDLRLAEIEVEAGAVDVSLARSSRWDDAAVGLFVEGERFRDEPEGIAPEALAGIRVSIPLPFWQDGSGRVAEKQAALERREGQLAALRRAVLNEVSAAYRVMVSRHRAAMVAINDVLPSARSQVTAAESVYARGELDLPTLIRSRERLAALEMTALETRKNFHLAHAEWLAATGEELTPP